MNTKYIIYRESWLSSLICDLQTLALMSIGFVVNEWYVHSPELAALLTISIVLWLISASSPKGNTFYKIEDVVVYLEKEDSE